MKLTEAMLDRQIEAKRNDLPLPALLLRKGAMHGPFRRGLFGTPECLRLLRKLLDSFKSLTRSTLRG